VSPARGGAAARTSGATTAISVSTTATEPIAYIGRICSSGVPRRPAEPSEKDEHQRRRYERSPPTAKAEGAQRIRAELCNHEHDRSRPGKGADEIQRRKAYRPDAGVRAGHRDCHAQPGKEAAY